MILIPINRTAFPLKIKSTTIFSTAASTFQPCPPQSKEKNSSQQKNIKKKPKKR